MSTPRLYRTDGIVVRRRDQGEADRVLTLCTPAGKIHVIAKGSRKVRSRKAGHVELFSRSRFVVSRVTNSWDIVSQAETIEPNEALRDDLMRGTYGRYVVELMDGFFAQDEGGPALYELLALTLRHLGVSEDLDLAARHFEQHLLGLAGFRPELFRCVGDHQRVHRVEVAEPARSGKPLGLDSERGGCLCPACYSRDRMRVGVVPMSAEALQFLRDQQAQPLPSAAGREVPEAVRDDAERAMHRYVTHHLERNVRSMAFLRQLKDNAGRSAVPDDLRVAETL